MELLGRTSGRTWRQGGPSQVDHLERLQLSLRREDGGAIPPEGYGVEGEWVTLEFGGDSATRHPERSEGLRMTRLALRPTRDGAVEQLGGNLQVHDGPRLEQDLSGAEWLPSPA